MKVCSICDKEIQPNEGHTVYWQYVDPETSYEYEIEDLCHKKCLDEYIKVSHPYTRH